MPSLPTSARQKPDASITAKYLLTSALQRFSIAWQGLGDEALCELTLKTLEEQAVGSYGMHPVEIANEMLDLDMYLPLSSDEEPSDVLVALAQILAQRIRVAAQVDTDSRQARGKQPRLIEVGDECLAARVARP